MAKKAQTFEDMVAAAHTAEKKLYADAGIARRALIAFPRHNKIPLLARFGMWLVNRAGGQIQFRYFEAKK